MSKVARKKVLFIGWDAADWKVISPLMDAGKMPAVRYLVENGVMANMTTLHPVLSPMLWTSIGTGKRPMKHGIFGFSEPTPDGGGVRPVTNLSRRCKAVWNIFTQSGLKTHVLGWWPSHPVEPINGVMVSNHFYQAFGPLEKGWPLNPGCVYPPTVSEALADLRFHPNELTTEEVLPFVPRAAEVDQEKDRRLASIMKVIAECTSVHSAATWVMENQEWDFLAVYYDAIDHFSHIAMRYHPPRLSWIPEKDFEIYQHVITSAYIYHDMMLRRLLQLAGPDATVVLMSDHGFHPDHLRPRFIPQEPAGPAAEHREHGIFVIKGPGIRRDEMIHGVSLLDVTPTLLTLFGLPVGEDMDGRVLTEVFEKPPEAKRIPSWEEIPGRDGRHPPGSQLDPFESKEAMEQLQALGYVEKLDDNREKAVAQTVRELRYNQARALMNADRHGEAAGLLRELWTDWPKEYRFATQLAFCYRALNRISDMAGLLSDIERVRRSDAKEARAKLKEWRTKLAERRAEKEKANGEVVPGDATAGAKPKDQRPPVRVNELTDEKELKEIVELRSRAFVQTAGLAYLRGYVAAAQGRLKEALKDLEMAGKADPSAPGIHLQSGEVYLQMKRTADAERSFQKVLEFDPLSAHAHHGLARCQLQRRRPFEAAAAAVKATGLLYRFPMAHFVLGVAMTRLAKPGRAIKALQTALEQNANFPEAHQWLARLYARRAPRKAEQHRQAARALRLAAKDQARASLDDLVAVSPAVTERASGRHSDDARPNAGIPDSHLGPAWPDRPAGDVITVVTGLPRTGTSMMMQMLVAGGLIALTDGKRAADSDNPRGYLEFEPATKLREDKSWVPQARGKVVKLVAQLLPFLPADQHYQIVFTHRDLREVIASQQAMLKRLGRKGGNLAPAKLSAILNRQVAGIAQWAARQPNIRVLHCEYGETLATPVKTSTRLAEFFGGAFAPTAAAGAVDPDLRRQGRH